MNVLEGINWVMKITTRSSLGSTQKIVEAAPPHGGHVAFVSADKEERFWAEERLADFCRLSDC